MPLRLAGNFRPSKKMNEKEGCILAKKALVVYFLGQTVI